MYPSHLLLQSLTDDRQREAERSLARAAARWRRRFGGPGARGAERVGVEPTRA